jgi:hypothetical protein
MIRDQPQSRLARHSLLVIVSAFVTLSTVYSIVTPIFEGPDEIWHYAFVDHLANGGGLPVFDAAQPATFLRNGAHPPLYYWPIAALVAPIDRGDFPAKYRFNTANPLITPGGQSDRPNLLIHTAREDWPYHNTALAVHIARLVSIVLDAIAIVGVWLVARQLLPGDDRLALIATTLAAFVPQFVYGAAMINNDALAAAAATWTVYALLRVMNDTSVKWSIVAGAVLGVTLLSKIGMIAILPLPALALLLTKGNHHADTRPHSMAKMSLRGRVSAWFRSRRWRLIVRAALIVYGIALLVAGWWYVRNGLLYGDPLAWREWQALVGSGRVPPTPSDFVHDMIGLFGTFWADFSLRLDRVWWPLFATIAIAVLSGLIRRARRREWPPLDRPGLLIALAWFVLLLASAVRYSFNIYDIHGRLLYPALAAIGVILALGLSGWPRSKWLIGGVLSIEIAMAALSPFVIIQPAYARPIVPALPDDATKTSVRFDGVFELMGYRIASERVKVNEPIDVITYWRRHDGLSFVPDLRAIVALVQPDGTIVGHAEAVLGSNAYPSSVWQSNDIVATELSVPTEGNVPAVANVALSVRGESAKLIPSDRGETLGLGRVVVTSDQPCQIVHPADVTFGGSIKLIGYRVEQSDVVGVPPRVILCWQSIRPVSFDYTVFVHVTDARGDPFTADAQPRGGDYPTSVWQAGEQIEDSHPLPAVIDLIIKRATIGLYRLDTGERLTIDGTSETEFLMADTCTCVRCKCF